MKSQQTIDVFFVVAPGAVLLDLAGPAEAFRIASDGETAFRLHFVGPARAPKTSIGIALNAIGSLPKSLPGGSVVMLTGALRAA